ncbi:MAG: helix-turn-helix domain-containing protein [Candidatus Pacebacteria bacterium]|nr:helix-turn-helix domain-containing protein [Candidatus Paceibacterota bacterium]
MQSDYDTGHWSVMELCRRYGVSRDTFYLWRPRRSAGRSARPPSSIGSPR